MSNIKFEAHYAGQGLTRLNEHTEKIGFDPMKHWDIFCKIVDNFGDIGVCWRLAKQLQAEHGLNVHLWVDDLHVAKKLIPALDPSHASQVIQHIHIHHWHADAAFNQAADVVIEAFGCELPAAYIAHMQPSTVWINLEYLSAEHWVAEFHGGSSKRGALTRHFFFPGFSEATGGLIREQHLAELNAPRAQQNQLPQNQDIQNHAIEVSLFCYPHAPIASLLSAMAQSEKPIQCWVPHSSIVPKIAQFFGQTSLHIGQTIRQQNLQLTILPFLSQAEYDQLLTQCHINFVRGEDSWIRAIWAGNAFIWQPYLQTEDTHITKLNAFLALFYASCTADAAKAVHEMQHAWLEAGFSQHVWENYLTQLPAIQHHTAQQSQHLAAQTDLATKLVIFSEKIANNRV